MAEWLLSLVLERSRAAAVTGDLLEIGAGRGEAWFWSNVLRTWLASVWSDAKSEPRFIVGMATLGALVCWGVDLFAQLAILFAMVAVNSWVLRPWGAHLEPSLLFGQLQMLAAFFAAAFYAGRWIARYSLGREIAVCFAMVVMGPVVLLGLSFLLWLFLTLSHDILRIGTEPSFRIRAVVFWLFFPVIPYFLGAGWGRRRRQDAAENRAEC